MASSSVGSNLVSSLLQQIGSVGKSAVRTVLNSIWPRDFELYMVSLELTDHNDKALDYITFPVNPDSIQKTEPYVNNITRATGAIVVNSSSMFVPQDIQIKGNFGKSFKMLLRGDSMSESFRAIVSSKEKGELSTFYKSGYGCLKVLQSICDKSAQKDDGYSRNLYFHNFALGESYLVRVNMMQEDMSMATNMIWGYSLSMKIISPINTSRSQNLKAALTALVQNTITGAVNSCLNAVTTTNWF